MPITPLSWVLLQSNLVHRCTMTSFHQNRKYKFVNNNKQPQATRTCNCRLCLYITSLSWVLLHPNLVTTTNSLRQQKLVIVVYVYNYPMLCPFVAKLGTLMYSDKVSSKQKLQVCKQQQRASGNKKLLMLFMFITCLCWVLLQQNLIHFCTRTQAQLCRKKRKETSK